MPFISKVQDDPEQSKYHIGFPKGLNSTQDKSLVDDKNLIVARNASLQIDGVSRRPGTDRSFDEASATKIYGGAPFYKKTAGTRKLVRLANQRLQILDDSVGTWSNVGSTAFSNSETNFIQARDRLYIYDGINNLKYYDGSTVTTYTSITTPTGLAVTAQFKDAYTVSSITRASAVATVTTGATNNFKSGDYVTISGAVQTEYNGKFQITVTSTTTFNFAVTGTPATPATGTIILTSAGNKAYSYEITAFNSSGESVGCTAVSITDGPESLSSILYNELTWSSVANATGYNIYGRYATGFGRTFMATIYTTSYKDTGVDTPVTTKISPTANNSGGVIAKGGCYTMGRQFVYGVTEGTTYYPTRLYYSGTINYVDSFVGNEFGGGWVEIYANDGGEIVDIAPFQNGVLIWKTNGVFKFYFSSGLPALDEVTRGHGGVSGRAHQAIDNDIIYVGQKDNRIGVFTIGNQENYVGNQLRTNDISIFYSNELDSVNRTYLKNIATWYYKDTFGFSYTTSGSVENDRGYVVDTRFGGWVYWDGLPMKSTGYVVYDNGTDVNLYGLSNLDGYMIKMFQTQTNDDGATYRTVVGTKFFNAGMFDTEKIWRNPTLWFRYISGEANLACEIWTDGNVIAGTAQLSQETFGSGVGADLAGSFLAGGMASGTETIEPYDDLPQELTMLKIARSLGFYLIDETLNSNWLFMGIHLLYTPLAGKPLREKFRAEIT